MLDRRTLLFALAASPIAGPALAQGGGPIVATIRLQDERVLIDALINGQGPFPFAVDTGAVVSGIEEEIALRLGLPILRKVRLASRQFDLFKVSDLVLGGAMRQADAALFGLKGNLRGAAGLIAAGMMTNFDSTLDFEQMQWRVYPGGLSERPGYEQLDSWIRLDPGANGSKRFGIRAMLDGKPVRLVVDTGLTRMVVLERDAGRRLGYWDETRPYAPAPWVGIGGLAPRPSRVIRCESLQLGGVRFQRPFVTVQDMPPTQEGYDGIIGLPVLEQMNLSIDVRAGGSLWVKANGRPSRRERISRTGLWLDEAPGGAKVSVVGKGSPAAAAGLKVGDRIKGESLSAILSLLNADRPAVTLTVEGRGPVTLIPADYI